jgi:hypothetical protein
LQYKIQEFQEGSAMKNAMLFGLALILPALVTLTAWCQVSALQDVLQKVNLDSLTTTVRVLSGETGSTNGGAGDTIHTRWYSESGNRLAAGYLRDKLESFGLTTQLQSFVGLFNVVGNNVLAEQVGDVVPQCKYIISAHFDSASDSNAVAPGADDNASGCAAVVEAARLLSRYTTAYSIVYALWDQGNLSLRGSDYYATMARSHGDSILGVLNLEMLGWDSNNDSLMDIHSSRIGRSTELADTVVLVGELYDIGLRPVIYSPAYSGTDHVSFWRSGYSAINMGEAFYGGDLNPNEGRRGDRLEHFNLSYFYRLSKLAVGTTAFLAGIQDPQSISAERERSRTFSLEQNYPNPFNPSTMIKFELPRRSYVSLIAYDILGRKVCSLVNERRDAGVHEVKFDGTGLAGGVYFYRLSTETFVETRKLLLLK